MCGIVGIWGNCPELAAVTRLAAETLEHRGPDDQGIWLDERVGLALGHKRLSILDLSAAGHQPMVSACGRYVIVLNGEIYNHLDLRRALDQLGQFPHPAPLVALTAPTKPGWRGHSDTETLLAYIAQMGVEKALSATIGMFAFALWDRHERELVLARDRMGEKPVYFGYVGRTFAFASELKAIGRIPGHARVIDRDALAMFLRSSSIPAPYCIYKGLKKLPPGTYLRITADQVAAGRCPRPLTYWSAIEVARSGVTNLLSFDSDELATSALESELARSIRGQMLSDVPLGAFLSGGVDSSTVVALMQAQSSRPVKTFSVGFHEQNYNEAHHAELVARHLGTDHTGLYVSSNDTMAVIPRLPEIYDEPFSDVSQIPTYLVAKLARQAVTVALSGDGGDELFAGYTRYTLAGRLWGRIERVPPVVRRAVAKAILAISRDLWDGLHSALAPLVPRKLRLSAPGHMMHKGAMLLGVHSGMDLYNGLMRHWEPSTVVVGANELGNAFADDSLSSLDLCDRMMLSDTLGYLPNDILVKVDRATMAVSLEARVPLLDHRVFEFAWRLPMQYKLRNGVGKWLLRQVLHRHVPAKLVDRPKMGFGVPIDSWLRGPLREWAEDLLAEPRLRQQGFLNPVPIRRTWLEHISGKRNWQYHLWDVLMFQQWLKYSHGC